MGIKKNFLSGAFLLFSSLAIFYACQKDSSIGGDSGIPPGKMKLSVRLTDGPSDFQKVFIDIQSIAVKVDTCERNGYPDHDHPGCDDHHDQMDGHCEYWDTLDIRPGIYDLMTLRNGLDTLIASGFLINGKIERIKFTLGDRDSVMVDSVMHPLNLIFHYHSVFVNIRREHLDSLSSNNFQLYLDFNLSRSIFYFYGKYWLSPVLIPFSSYSFGSIEGKIKPDHSYGFVKAFNATDTSYAWPWNEGYFKIRGLRPGTYSMLISGRNGYKDSTLNNITVDRGRNTKVGTIQLHQ
ncbi:MAG: DUF4382 domain-containing protein [Bacteroidetes bacterium]|nr:DUF4382 domain-containing protein [Bacteroidota bacterium]MBS1930222.1 DUF4382 domain-containing protein [Bacteroidota bacterium]